MNVFNGSMAGISCFTHDYAAFSYGVSLQKVGLLCSAEFHSKNSRGTYWYLTECNKAGSYPPSHTQLLKKCMNEIFTENKS